ncbi:universal stress protein [Ktedonospora formicarum]|uniref:Universal stress protein UspA n=1 Tax=Ktedonospora formicarum TaxID=2778364 RepID=A0A8J3MXM1_9CHLR|nr:universal stress protein [Ktedonospora formicarum]GHO48725.1 universal stress protein UspA [Ktedonospora formicarum]
MFHTILVPLDGSPQAGGVLPLAAGLARAQRGILILVRSLTFPIPSTCLSLKNEIVSPEMIDAEQRRVQAYLDQIATNRFFQNLEVRTKMAYGDPANAILDCAQQQHADLIVLCRHGAHSASQWILGSVAQKIARYSLIPVLVQTTGVPFLPEHAGVVHTLVPLDGSAFAEEALAPAIELSQNLSPSGTVIIHLLSVLPPFVQDGATGKEMSPLVREAQIYLKELEERLLRQASPHIQLKVTASLQCAVDVAQAIIEYSQHGHLADGQFTECDIIAMATHGRKGLARWAMGSIAERVLATTRHPLLLVRPNVIRQAHSVSRKPEGAFADHKRAGKGPNTQ